jgi:hypothetical protein
MKRCSGLVMVALCLAAIMGAGPASGEVTNISTVDDANDILPIDPNDYGIVGVGQTDPNEVADANEYVHTSESNGDAGGYDDSNIHSAFDIINPIRLTAGSSGATQSLVTSQKAALPTLTSTAITPTAPRSSDEIVATFGGNKGSHYVIDTMVVDVWGNLITLDVTWRRNATLDGPVVDYSQSQSLGTLNAGSYTLQVKNYYDGRLCASMSKFFNVAAASTGINTDSLWDSLGGHVLPSNSNLFANWPEFDLFH